MLQPQIADSPSNNSTINTRLEQEQQQCLQMAAAVVQWAAAVAAPAGCSRDCHDA
jgi:hypothetical protein